MTAGEPVAMQIVASAVTYLPYVMVSPLQSATDPIVTLPCLKAVTEGVVGPDGGGKKFEN